MAEDQVKDQAQEETPAAEETTETAEATEAPEAKPKDAQEQEEELFGKPLDKMTVKELRELALTMQGIVASTA